MIHGEGPTVEVCGEQRLWMAGRRQVERHIVRVRIPRGIEIDRRLHPRPFSLRHRWVGAKQIIESQTSPPRDRTPAFDANQPRNLLTHREASHEIPNVERNAQARSEPLQSEIPSRYIARVRSGSVVVVPDRGNLRFCVGGHHTIPRVECFSHVVVNSKSFVEQPLLPRRTHISAHAHATECIWWQKKSCACCRRQRADSKRQHFSPSSIAQDACSHLNYGERLLFKETLVVLHEHRFQCNGCNHFASSRRSFY